MRGQDNNHSPSPHSSPGQRLCRNPVIVHESSKPHHERECLIVNSSAYPFALSPSKGSERIATQSLEGEEVHPCRLTDSPKETRRSCRNQLSRVSRGLCVSVMLVFAFLAGCQQKMADQPRYEPLSRSTFFGDDRAARPLVEGTVARGQLRTDEHLYTGKEAGKLVDTFPFPVTLAVLTRGQLRFNIFCSPCHDRVGTGQGMIVRRGYRAPPSFHIDRLRQAPAGHFFERHEQRLRCNAGLRAADPA